jgi:hypothetical protein
MDVSLNFTVQMKVSNIMGIDINLKLALKNKILCNYKLLKMDMVTILAYSYL